ncbi:MAG: DUF2156 domain-containing protein [Deltaproteobacteria bacterium]|nr:DUF2156 domain-containing protein [Deltaproteobacteria bacterium]
MILSPISFSDLNTLKPYFENQPHELCSYCLEAIIVWIDGDYCPHAGVTDGSLIVKAQFSVSTQRQHLLMPIAPNSAFSPLALQDLALDQGIEKFWYVPESYIQHHGHGQVSSFFHIQEQPAFHDYIYRTSDLATLAGNRYAKKRNLINQFERNYVDKGRVELTGLTPSDVEPCLAFLEKWCKAYDCDGEDNYDLFCEKQAIINTLENQKALVVKGLVLRIDGDVCAFGIGSRLTVDMGVLQFEKAFSDIKGLYQYFDRQCARQIFSGFTYLNKESDMGEPGLAKAKKSYHPVRIVKSYQLTVR